MKKIIALILICLLGLVGCNAEPEDLENSSTTVETLFVVLEVSESNLLVAEIGDDGNPLESSRYVAPNMFYPTEEINEGEKVLICHSGEILETFPMQFGKIYSMAIESDVTNMNAD